MSLPIDPEQLTAEDIGEKQATLDMGHDEAVEHVREAFTAAGFGVPVEFSPSELLREKVGSDRDPYYVLGACNPHMADRALDVTERIGAIFPCNVVVWEVEPGLQQVYHVSIMRIARLVAIAPDDDEWAEIVAETGEMVEQAMSNLDSSASGEKPRGSQGGKSEGSGGSPR
ncbi:hypothetical protein HAPAU_03730 [Halalkalicoccus paucihalophilus]|uniref:DUF302 domain-containing protein n=1 Tax=Halalkalicoccus paucihalophilus TaxID=1008153 RepID=A0A151AJG2_9EURY|nr:hypothetical protein HAPAU_03730 [Halalkalicoccus paucihalophilus]